MGLERKFEFTPLNVKRQRLRPQVLNRLTARPAKTGGECSRSALYFGSPGFVELRQDRSRDTGHEYQHREEFEQAESAVVVAFSRHFFDTP